MLTIILVLCMAPITPILYFMLRNEAKPKKNIILGVTLPNTAQSGGDVENICAAFKKWLALWSAVMFVLVAPAFVLTSMSYAMIYLMSWMIAAIIAPYAVYLVHHRKLKALKRERGWSGETRAVVDVKIAASPFREVSALWFIPPFAISLIPVIYSFGPSGLLADAAAYGTLALMIPLFWFIYRMMYRRRAEVFNDNSELTAALTRVRRYNWSKSFIFMSWLTGLFNITFWLFIDDTVKLLIATGIYTAAVLTVSMLTEFKARAAQQKLTANYSGVYVDDDAHWPGGILYYNPDDRHLIVNNRVGIGTTVNIARPAGMVIILFSVLLIAAMPFLGIWMSAEEHTPVRIELGAAELSVYHTSREYTVNLASVNSVELIDRLPAARKVMGSNFDNLLKGRFSLDGLGVCELCLNPRDPPFIVIYTHDKTYVFGAAGAAEIYGNLK